MATCPECGALLDLETDDIEEGALFSCPECDLELEVVSTHPLELDIVGEEDEAEEEDEDLDDEEFEEDEEEEDEEDEDSDDEDFDEDDNGFY